jgi:hypothetical protein
MITEGWANAGLLLPQLLHPLIVSTLIHFGTRQEECWPLRAEPVTGTLQVADVVQSAVTHTLGV